MACCFGESVSLDREQNIPRVTESPDRINAFLRLLMKDGARGQKATQSGSRDRKTFVLDNHLTKLSYYPTSKKKDNSIGLRNIWEIRSGDDASPGLEKAKLKEGEDYPFAVVLKDGRTLSIIMDTEGEMELFVQALAFLVRSRRAVLDDDPHRIRLMELWMNADANGDRKLSLTELSEILHLMNVNIDNSTLKRKFTAADEDGSGTLDFQEFAEFYNQLTTRNEVKPLFKRYANDNGAMGDQAFFTFLKEIQGEEISHDLAHKILKMCEGGKQHTTSDHPAVIGFPEFVRFLLNPSRNGWGDPVKLETIVEDDMKHPLHHYYIASSHNTYLSGDQLQSDSRCDMYRMAHRSGCRCVELDCWDGDGSEPVIYHGYTRTSKILFRDVIKAIKETAFETSSFPIILSLEVHTGKEQSDVMANHIKNEFKGSLYTYVDYQEDLKTRPESEVWTPWNLQNKVLVKWKLTDDGSDDEKDDDDIEEIQREKKKQQQQGNDPHRKKDHGDLGRVVMVAAMKTKTWGEGAAGFNIESIKEGTCVKHGDKSPEELRLMNTRMMTRVYPAGSRVDSSNYNPCVGWEHGAQCVALNYQTWDEWMRVNDAKFLQNKRCGYLLKPDYLRDASLPRLEQKWTLRINVILGSQFPKPEGSDADSEIIDPYVKILVRGSKRDEEANPSVRTKTVDDNGFSPFWDETFEFTLMDLNDAMITMRVLDSDLNQDDEIGEGSMSVAVMRQGYRAVGLRDTFSGRELEHSAILCHISLYPHGSNGAPQKLDDDRNEEVVAQEEKVGESTAPQTEESWVDVQPAQQ